MSSEENNLNVDVVYDEKIDLITVTFQQDDQLITIGFDIGEAQLFYLKIADAITTAILGKAGLTPPPETKH